MMVAKDRDSAKKRRKDRLFVWWEVVTQLERPRGLSLATRIAMRCQRKAD